MSLWKSLKSALQGGPGQPARPRRRVESLEPTCCSPQETGPVKLEITDVLDLHPFAPKEVKDIVETYLDEARAQGFTTVRIIHGKGIGVQREMVRTILSRKDFISNYEDAPMDAGSWGATIVWFKKVQGE